MMHKNYRNVLCQLQNNTAHKHSSAGGTKHNRLQWRNRVSTWVGAFSRLLATCISLI